MAASTVPHGTAVWKMFAGGALAEPTATTAVTNDYYALIINGKKILLYR